MKRLCLVVALLATACAANVVTTNNVTKPSTTSSSAPELGSLPGAGPLDSCGSHDEIVGFDLEGQWTTVSVPTPCDPFYLDRGDPPDQDENGLKEKSAPQGGEQLSK